MTAALQAAQQLLINTSTWKSLPLLADIQSQLLCQHSCCCTVNATDRLVNEAGAHCSSGYVLVTRNNTKAVVSTLMKA